MSAIMTNPSLFLEILNGGAVSPELLWLMLLAIYLSKESRRRGLHWFDWFHLPPSMNLIVAIVISDTGVCLRSVTVWTWRRFGHAGNLNEIQSVLLVIGGALIIIGALCKIRAITGPDHGNGPWLIAMTATAAVITALLFFR